MKPCMVDLHAHVHKAGYQTTNKRNRQAVLVNFQVTTMPWCGSRTATTLGLRIPDVAASSEPPNRTQLSSYFWWTGRIP